MSSTFPPPPPEPEPEPESTTESKLSRYVRRKAIDADYLLQHNQKKPLTNEELRKKHFRPYMSDADNNPRKQLNEFNQRTTRRIRGQNYPSSNPEPLTEDEARAKYLTHINGGKRTRKLKKRKTRKHKKKNKKNTRK